MDKLALKQFQSYAGDCNIATITQTVVRKFKETRLEQVKPTSVSIELRSLRAAFLGHSSVKVTEIYTHVPPEDMKEVAEALTCVG